MSMSVWFFLTSTQMLYVYYNFGNGSKLLLHPNCCLQVLILFVQL